MDFSLSFIPKSTKVTSGDIELQYNFKVTMELKITCYQYINDRAVGNSHTISMSKQHNAEPTAFMSLTTRSGLKFFSKLIYIKVNSECMPDQLNYTLTPLSTILQLQSVLLHLHIKFQSMQCMIYNTFSYRYTLLILPTLEKNISILETSAKSQKEAT